MLDFLLIVEIRAMAIIENGICQIKYLDKHALGIADTNTGVTKVPYCLEGESIAFEKHSYRNNIDVLNRGVIELSKNRVIPPCKYFGVCGGCMLQHMNEWTYEAFKLKLITDALLKHGIKIDIDPIIRIPQNLRRRANFKAVRKGENVLLGFHRFHSNQIINIDSCMALLPTMSNLLEPLRELLLRILDDKEKAEMYINQVDNGIDLLIECKNHKASLAVEYVLEFMNQHNITRICINSSEFIRDGSKKPYVAIDDREMQTNPRSFMQASKESERILQDLVLSAIGKDPGKVVDLFSGIGTFGIILSKYHQVDCFESDAYAASILKDLVVQRDLYKHPISSADLKKYNYAVLNPPRAGASAQVKELAKSHIEKILYVSCNPESFAKDASVLLSHYKLQKITPVDQFLWSPHIEVVAELVLRHL